MIKNVAATSYVNINNIKIEIRFDTVILSSISSNWRRQAKRKENTKRRPFDVRFAEILLRGVRKMSKRTRFLCQII